MTNLRKIENLHVALWLLKDCSWCSGWHWLGLTMAVPTLVLAGKIAWATRKETTELVHNIAVLLWMCANIIWMVGEFYFDDGTRWFAKIFFFTGLVLLTSYYAMLLARRCKSGPERGKLEPNASL